MYDFLYERALSSESGGGRLWHKGEKREPDLPDCFDEARKIYLGCCIICGLFGVVSFGLLNGKRGDTLGDRKVGEITIKEERDISKARIFSIMPVEKKRFYQEGPVCPFFSPTDEIWVEGRKDNVEDVFTLEGKANLLWINAVPLSDGEFLTRWRFLAYPGPKELPG